MRTLLCWMLFLLGSAYSSQLSAQLYIHPQQSIQPGNFVKDPHLLIKKGYKLILTVVGEQRFMENNFPDDKPATCLQGFQGLSKQDSVINAVDSFTVQPFVRNLKSACADLPINDGEYSFNHLYLKSFAILDRQGNKIASMETGAMPFNAFSVGEIPETGDILICINRQSEFKFINKTGMSSVSYTGRAELKPTFLNIPASGWLGLIVPIATKRLNPFPLKSVHLLSPANGAFHHLFISSFNQEPKDWQERVLTEDQQILCTGSNCIGEEWGNGTIYIGTAHSKNSDVGTGNLYPLLNGYLVDRKGKVFQKLSNALLLTTAGETNIPIYQRKDSILYFRNDTLKGNSRVTGIISININTSQTQWIIPELEPEIIDHATYYPSVALNGDKNEIDIGYKWNNKYQVFDLSGNKKAEISLAPYDGYLRTDEGFLVWKGDKYGAVDNKGKLILPIEYLRIVPEKGDETPGLKGRWMIKNEKGWGMTDLTGKILVAPQFDNFIAGIDLLISQKGGLWGYYDLNGKMIIPHRFSEARDFSCGYAVVSEKTGGYIKYGYIDRKGIYLVKPQFDFCQDLVPGSCALVKKGKLCNFVDNKGVYCYASWDMCK